MKRDPIEALKLYERIHDVIKVFGQRATWTPAEGAMLVSGVRPPSVDAQAIPEQAMHLFDEASPATRSQLRDANRVLAAWHEYRDWDREEGINGEYEKDPTPERFVEWCDEEFQERARRPLWLEHFVGRAPGEPPAAIPAEFASQMAVRLSSIEPLQRERDAALVVATNLVAALAATSTQRAEMSVDRPALANESPYERALSERAWAKLETWIDNRAQANSKTVVKAALQKLGFEVGRKFIITDVQRIITEDFRAVCEDFRSLETVRGTWGFRYWTADGDKTCGTEELAQVLERWEKHYDAFRGKLAKGQ